MTNTASSDRPRGRRPGVATQTIFGLNAAIGRIFTEERERRGLLQREVGELAGVRGSQVSRYERGHATHTTTALVLMSRAFGLNPAVVLQRALDEIEGHHSSKVNRNGAGNDGSGR